MLLIALFFYNALFPLIFLLYFPFFLHKIIRRGNYRKGFFERFGIYSKEKRQYLKHYQEKCQLPIWIHAVSVGETVAALTFIQEWKKSQSNTVFVLSTTTSTGQEIISRQTPENVLPIYFPLDWFVFTLMSLKVIRPRFMVIFEVEIWPTILFTASRSGIPIALINARMSDTSHKGYQKFPWIFQPVFRCFSVICAQTNTDAEKIKGIIGGENPPVHVCNTMKFDQRVYLSSKDTRNMINEIFFEPEKIIFTAASTHPGEERLIIRIVKQLLREFPSLYLVLIPRHVERTNEIEHILHEEKISHLRLTDVRTHRHKSKTASNDIHPQEEGAKIRVLLVNTTGEMLDFLETSDVVFMGKSLAGNHGGHNIIEPAILGKPILFGNQMDNFRTVVSIFKKCRACVEVYDEETCLIALEDLLRSPEKRISLGNASRKTVEKNCGATKKTIYILQKILHERYP